MSGWYKRDKRRFLREAGEVKVAYPKLVFRPDGEGQWEGYVSIDGQDVHVRLEYVASHPRQPPRVFHNHPLAPISSFDHRASHHQFRDGSLCLYTEDHDESGWHIGLTTKDVLDRFCVFMRMERDGTHVREYYSQPERLPGAPSRRFVLVERSVAQVMTIPGAWGHWAGQETNDGQRLVIASARVHGRDIEASSTEDRWRFIDSKMPRQGRWQNVGELDDSWRRLIPDQEVLHAALSSPLLENECSGPILFAHGQDETVAEAIIAIDAATWSSAAVDVVAFPESFFQRNAAARPRANLGEWTAIMIGLGSLGSQVAVHLANAGVTRFVLFDPDVVRPENISRHAAGVGHLYQPKVEAMKALLFDRNPDVWVEVHPGSPLWTSSPEAAKGSEIFGRLLSKDKHLAVITVAEDTVERSLNQILVDAGMPAVYASVLGNAEHGRIFRVLPQETGCYECLLMAQNAFPETQPRYQPKGTPPHAYHAGGVPGLGVDVVQVALHTTRMVLQTIQRKDPAALHYGKTDPHHRLVTQAGGWVFEHPFEVRDLRLPQSPMCPVCGAHRKAPLDAEDAKRWARLVKNLAK